MERANEAFLSPNGVCYDIERSPYRYTRDGITYRFSTMRNRKRFMETVGEAECKCNGSMRNRFHFDVDMGAVGAIQHYARMESRGFCVEVEGEGVARCLDSLRFVGGRVTLRR